MELVLEKVKCFFNFRSPYAYLGVKKAIEESIDMEFFPLCYMPKEIVDTLKEKGLFVEPTLIK